MPTGVRATSTSTPCSTARRSNRPQPGSRESGQPGPRGMPSFDVRSPRLVAPLGAALLAAGAVAILASVLWGQARMQRAGSDHPVDAGAGNLGNINAHNSPTVVR